MERKSGLSILFLCTGNVCRSPVAEHILEAALRRSSLSDQIRVISAGTHADSGSSIDQEAAEILKSNGLELLDTVAMKVDLQLLREADLVLAMASEHRAFVAHLDPSFNRKTFTLGEYARICGYLQTNPEIIDEEPAQQVGQNALDVIQEKLLLAEKYRGYAPKAETSENIDDPLEGGKESFERAHFEIQSYLKTVMDFWGLS